MNLRRTFFAGLAAAVLAAACGGGGGISGTGMKGTLRLALTDAPACGYDAVNVTIEKIRVHQSASAADTDAGWAEIVLAPAPRLDLLTLTNGVLHELGAVELPAGRYTQMRLVLAPNGPAAPYANSVVPTGSAETALTTPSAQQSGLKLNLDIEVPADKIADFVLDFDACKSVVKRGASGQYNLKPVIAVIPRLGDAGLRVIGHVDPSIAGPGTAVSLQLGGVPVKATVPASDGQFVLYPVPTGQYDLVVSAAGRVTAVMTGVPVVSTAFTTVNPPALPILPPALTQPARAVAGTVTPATATVRALQSLTDGPTIEAAWAPVDADSGAFALALPVDPPVRTLFRLDPLVLDFQADTAVGARYTVEAESAGVRKTTPIDAAAVVPDIAFTFP
jgi:hypothetical protein